MDTSPTKRRATPEFYGFVPATGRGLIFFLMMVNSTSQFLAKIMSIALLGAVSNTWTFGYLVGDIVFYLVYTIVRNDFFYFIPIQSYLGSLTVSFVARVSQKVRECMQVEREGDDGERYSSNLVQITRNHRSSSTIRLCCNSGIQ